ncbi:MAG: hypothetical protein GY711_07275 [bacterium]|nr:hypothetical protein [bacterium]
MRSRLLLFSLAVAVAGGAWFFVATGPGVAVSGEDVARAVADGSGAAAIDLAPTPTPTPTPADGVADGVGTASAPTSLDDLLAIGDRAGIEAARDAWLAAMDAGDAGEGELSVLLSAVQRRLGESDEAVRYAERGVELLPVNGRAHHVLARALAQRMQKSSKFQALMTIGTYKSELRAAIELDPTNGPARKEEILMLAFAPKPVGDRARAIELARAFAGDDALLGAECLARALVLAGEEEEGLGVLDEALAKHPESRDLHWVKGTLLERAERRDQADASFVAAMGTERDETFFQALFQRAKIRVEGGYELERALGLLEQYVAADPFWEWSPRLARAHEQLGKALEALGRPSEALQAYEMALALDADREELQDAIARLKN